MYKEIIVIFVAAGFFQSTAHGANTTLSNDRGDSLDCGNGLITVANNCCKDTKCCSAVSANEFVNCNEVPLDNVPILNELGSVIVNVLGATVPIDALTCKDRANSGNQVCNSEKKQECFNIVKIDQTGKKSEAVGSICCNSDGTYNHDGESYQCSKLKCNSGNSKVNGGWSNTDGSITACCSANCNKKRLI